MRALTPVVLSSIALLLVPPAASAASRGCRQPAATTLVAADARLRVYRRNATRHFVCDRVSGRITAIGSRHPFNETEYLQVLGLEGAYVLYELGAESVDTRFETHYLLNARTRRSARIGAEGWRVGEALLFGRGIVAYVEADAETLQRSRLALRHASGWTYPLDEARTPRLTDLARSGSWLYWRHEDAARSAFVR